MKDYSTENIINIAITGHAATGKTILSEAMACNAGVIHKMGSIEEGTTLSDYRNYEIDNQIRYENFKKTGFLKLIRKYVSKKIRSILK